jgi:lysine 6-dehydrogenase
MRSVIVLGVGRVGAAMARDLAADPRLQVTAADASDGALARLRETPEGAALRTVPVDLSDPAALREALDGHDLAIGAVPGPMGFETLRQVLAAGVHIVDISFCEQDTLQLDHLARDGGRVAIVDAGVAPGLSNLILGHHEARLQDTTRFECVVGGVPAEPRPPWNYKAPFSPIDVIAEYTRPARFRRAGQEVTLPALAELEEVRLPDMPPMEAFLTDGLRSLLHTSRAPDLVEKTLRWPGHADRIGFLRDAGLLDMAIPVLFEAWSYEPGEVDLTVMRVVVEGRDTHGAVRHTYHLHDRLDPRTGVSSMARTTGYTATAIARLVLAGKFTAPGVSPPERVGADDGTLDHVLGALRDRGIRIDHGVERL